MAHHIAPTPGPEGEVSAALVSTKAYRYANDDLSHPTRHFGWLLTEVLRGRLVPPGGAYRRLTSRVFGKTMNVLHVEVPARALAADPAAFYNAIVYYWRRREARSELVNDSAVHRIHTGNFGLPPQVIIDYGQTQRRECRGWNAE